MDSSRKDWRKADQLGNDIAWSRHIGDREALRRESAELRALLERTEREKGPRARYKLQRVAERSASGQREAIRYDALSREEKTRAPAFEHTLRRERHKAARGVR